ncbi:MAG: hypothetical protein J4F50_04405 [Acidimicrobiia bacterium]|nr:hypothetical protein [Acidimicrobiia bacterium]
MPAADLGHDLVGEIVGEEALGLLADWTKWELPTVPPVPGISISVLSPSRSVKSE